MKDEALRGSFYLSALVQTSYDGPGTPRPGRGLMMVKRVGEHEREREREREAAIMMQRGEKGRDKK